MAVNAEYTETLRVQRSQVDRDWSDDLYRAGVMEGIRWALDTYYYLEVDSEH